MRGSPLAGRLILRWSPHYHATASHLTQPLLDSAHLVFPYLPVDRPRPHHHVFFLRGACVGWEQVWTPAQWWFFSSTPHPDVDPAQLGLSPLVVVITATCWPDPRCQTHRFNLSGTPYVGFHGAMLGADEVSSPPHSHVVPAVLILFDCGNGGGKSLVGSLPCGLTESDTISWHRNRFFKGPFAELLHWLGVSPRKCATSERCPCQGATPTVTSTCPWSGGGGGTLRTGAYAVLTIFIGGLDAQGHPHKYIAWTHQKVPYLGKSCTCCGSRHLYCRHKMSPAWAHRL